MLERPIIEAEEENDEEVLEQNEYVFAVEHEGIALVEIIGDDEGKEQALKWMNNILQKTQSQKRVL